MFTFGIFFIDSHNAIAAVRKDSSTLLALYIALPFGQYDKKHPNIVKIINSLNFMLNILIHNVIFVLLLKWCCASWDLVACCCGGTGS